MPPDVPYAPIYNREPRIPLTLAAPALIMARFTIEAGFIIVDFDQPTLKGLRHDSENASDCTGVVLRGVSTVAFSKTSLAPFNVHLVLGPVTAAVASTSPLEASFVSCEMTAAYTFAFLVSGLVSSRS